MFNTALFRCLIGLVLLTTTAITCAETRSYDIEVVIFENIDVPHAANTLWDHQTYIPLLKDANTPKSGRGVQPLTSKSRRLANAAAAIKKSSRYKLLTHQVWRQATQSKKKAIPVRIQQGEPVPVFVETGGSTNDNAPSSGVDLLTVDNQVVEVVEAGVVKARGLQNQRPPDRFIRPVENFQPAFVTPDGNLTGSYTQTLAYPLDGTITVAVSRYLHVYTDLALTKTLAPADMQSFIVKSHRRMRSRELHYIDHPKVGMLILITPS